MATTPKRTRTGKANVWEFLLALSGNPTIVGLLRFLTVSAVLCFLLVVGLQGRSFSVAGWAIGAQPTPSAPVVTSAEAHPDTPLLEALPGSNAPGSTSTPAQTVATMTPVVDASPTPTVTQTICPPSAAALPRNAQWITCAWGFWNDAMYVETVTVAEQCIDEFEGQALRDQQALSTAEQPLPITGKPGSKAEQNEILARGVLNDVAACYFVKGQALERLGRASEATQAYRDVLQFPHARVWDPGGDPSGLGFFWSPAQAASDRLARMP